MAQPLVNPQPIVVVDVPAARAQVAAFRVRLRNATAGLPMLVSPAGVLDKTLLAELVNTFSTAGSIAKEIVTQYDYHDAGLLILLADELASGGAAVDTQVLAYANQTLASPRLRALLSDTSAAAAIVEANLRRVASDYDIAAMLPTDLKAFLPGWLATRLPNPLPDEVRLLLALTKADFANMVRRYADQKKLAASSTVVLTDVAAAAERHIFDSTVVGPQLNGWVGKGDIANNFVLLDDTSFVAAFVDRFYRNNKTLVQGIQLWRTMPIRDVDNVGGFAAHGTMYLLDGCVAVPLAVHEAMHLLAEKRGHVWKAALGMVLEEAAAEYLCRSICEEAKVPYVLDGYYNNVILLETIMDKGGLKPEHVIDGYLNGITDPVVKAIRKISGDAGLHTLLTSTDQTGYETYNAWVENYRAVGGKTCLVQ